MLAGTEGIVGARAREDASAHLAHPRRLARGEASVEAHDGANVGPAPGELERCEAAEAVTDRGRATRNAIVCCEATPRSPRADAEDRRLRYELSDDGHPARPVGEDLAEEVGGERDVPAVGEPPGTVPLVIAQPRSPVKEEDSASYRMSRRRGEDALEGSSIDFVRGRFEHVRLPLAGNSALLIIIKFQQFAMDS
jgi:hypothetical protein